ncbi:peptidase M24 [Aureimonas sp. SA4125]|uniref:M23 family metallopeptidase n=1 Tax=Aureimonas sp. SA4125 TaxID=2826993 RepID=UPI001CC4628B|nr:M23 family metallopeptidase [Aureimonas sp. SA4125]BDA86076.1 peptidase M24 [Aureimonas sp. SA4125]
MSQKSPPRPELGNEPPLVADRRRRPDRRQVSARWLAGTLLTGLTSSALMGIALSAALDGRHTIARPASTLPDTATTTSDEPSAKSTRVFATLIPAAKSRQTLEFSTMTRDGDREVIRTLPFAYVTMSLAARHPTNIDYPPFDPMKVFTAGDGDEPEEADPAQIYGDKIESQMTLKMEPFSFSDLDATEIDDVQAEAQVRMAAPTLSYVPVQVASLDPIDPLRFAPDPAAEDYEPGSAFRVIEENVSVAIPDGDDIPLYNEEAIRFSETQPILAALAEAGYEEGEAAYAAERLSDLLSTKTLGPGNIIRVGSETEGGTRRIVRLSVYRGDAHMVTVAEGDDGSFAPGAQPDLNRDVAEALDQNAAEVQRHSDMPMVYDGIYQAALSYGLDTRLCQQLVRMLASDVDFQARLSPDDRLTVFYSLEEGKENATDASEILYAEAQFGDETKKFYRFRGKDDEHSDYYDEEGRSSRQFLLRKPVPKARMSSAFSTGRKHPVLGYVRPHWGVDWAAPAGSPIIATGSGVVEAAGWSSGYGRQTILRHANGYETSYSHQSTIAKGITKGARVRQGQVIGFVGSTGLSTGNHTHYEVSVNGQKVDPMRIKLPSGRVLAGADLDLFKRERDRIDNLLKDRDDPTRVAGR